MEIPKEAKQYPSKSDYGFKGLVEAWFCPDCNATGNNTDLDFVRNSRYFNYEPEDKVEYCCKDCFSTNLYFILSPNE